jgi:hypothetical protein
LIALLYESRFLSQRRTMRIRARAPARISPLKQAAAAGRENRGGTPAHRVSRSASVQNGRLSLNGPKRHHRRSRSDHLMSESQGTILAQELQCRRFVDWPLNGEQ